MSIIETITDVNNTFLSRRELTCNFAGLGGKLKKLEAVDMITKEFKLDGKVVIPMGLKTHVGKPTITGTFYVYDDEGLAKKQIDPTIFSRLEKTKAKLAKVAEEKASAEEKPAEDEKAAKDAEVKADEKPAKDKTKEAPAKEKPAKDAEVKVDEKPAKDKTKEAPAEEKPAKDAEVKVDEKPAKPKEEKSK